MASVPTARISEEEYLRLERLAETKSEFYDGKIFAVSGGTFNHSVLTGANRNNSRSSASCGVLGL